MVVLFALIEQCHESHAEKRSLRRQAAAMFRSLRYAGLIQRVREKQARETLIEPVGPFPVAAQRALCEKVMRLLGFDFEAGRLGR